VNLSSLLKTADLLRNEKFLAWKVDRKTKKYTTVITSAQQHYSVADIAKQWGVSTDLVRSVFAEEPGVLRFTRPRTKNKRQYETLRIPESVLVRVHTRLSAAA
jgi:hypothetical protein